MTVSNAVFRGFSATDKDANLANAEYRTEVIVQDRKGWYLWGKDLALAVSFKTADIAKNTFNYLLPRSTSEAAWEYAQLSFIQRMLRLALFKTADGKQYVFDTRIPLTSRHIKGVPLSLVFDMVYAPINWLSFRQCRKESYDAFRAQAARSVFTGLGAEIENIRTEDGIEIETMIFRASKMKAEIEKLGGKWEKRDVDGEGLCLVIIPPDEGVEEQTAWDQFYQKALMPMSKGRKAIFWPKQTIMDEGKLKTVFITSKNAHLIPDIDTQAKKTNLVFFSEIAIPMTMRKRRIAYWLGQGLDVAIYNGHGMEACEGVASEEASYEDACAAADYIFSLKKADGTSEYAPARTWVFAACGATFSGAMVVKQYHEKGINCFFEAPPKSLKAAFNSYDWQAQRITSVLLSVFSLFSLKLTNLDLSREEILNTSDDILKRKYGENIDGWDVEQKFLALKEKQKGRAFFIGIEGDHLSSPEGVRSLAQIMQGKKEDQKHVVYKHFDPNMGRQSHVADGFREESFQEDILTAIHQI